MASISPAGLLNGFILIIINYMVTKRTQNILHFWLMYAERLNALVYG